MSGSLVDVTRCSWSASVGDTRIDQLVQEDGWFFSLGPSVRLEEACERVSRDESLAVMRDDRASAKYVPLRVREIVQHCLTHPRTSSGGDTVEGKGEGREPVEKGRGRMEEELERVRELLQKTQRENEDLRLKYIAVSEKIEEMFQLQAEVSSLTFQTAHLREDNSRLQKTLLDQETAFSYALRTSHTEKLERDGRIVRMEKQIQEHESQCHELEQQLSSREVASEEEKSHLVSSIRRLEEEVLRVRREGEEAERAHHQELRQAVEKAEEEEQKAQELLLVNEQLQQQVAEVQSDSNRLMEDVHQLSLTLSQTQGRLLDLEAQREESFLIVQDQSARSQQLSLTLALRDVSSVQRELSLTKEAIESDLVSGGKSLTHATEELRTAVHQNTLHLEEKNVQLRKRMTLKQDENQMLSQQLSEAMSEKEEQKAQHLTAVAELQATLEGVSQELSREKEECQTKAVAMQTLEQTNVELQQNQQSLQLQLDEAQQVLSSVRTEAIELKKALDLVVKLLTAPARESDEEKAEGTGEDNAVRVDKWEEEDSTHITSQFTVDDTDLVEAGVASRLKDQALSLIKQQLKANKMKLQSLQRELRSTEEQARRTVSQLQGDLQSQALTSQEKLTELETSMHELTIENETLQKDLEISQRCLEEAKIGSSKVTSQLEELKAGNLRLEQEHAQMQQQLQNLREGVQRTEEALANKQAELSDRQERVQQLQTQLFSVSRESESLRSQLVELKSNYQEATEEASDKTRQLGTLELERKKLQHKLDASQETASKLKETLTAEEMEKRRVQGLLEAAQKKVGQLTSSLQDVQEHLENAQNEMNQMKRENATLSDDLTQHKLALSGAQSQCTQLNNVIAKMAKEKGDLVREKVSLRVQVIALEDTVSLMKKKQVQVSQERNWLEQRVKDLEKRSFLEELNKSLETELVSSSTFSLSSKAEYQRGSGGEDGDVRLQDTLARLKKKELELQSGLEACRLEHEVQLKQVKEEHRKTLLTLRRQHENAYSSWRTEMDTLHSNQREQLSKVEATLRERDSRIEALRKSKELSEVECEKLKRELTSLQNEMEKLMQGQAQSDGRFTWHLPSSGQTSDNQRLQAKSPDSSLLTEELQSCREKLQQLQKEVTLLREKNKLLQGERKELEAAVTKAEFKSSTLQNSLTSQIENSDHFQQQVKNLLREGDEHKRKQQLRDEERQRQVRELTTKLSVLQMHHDELQKEIRRIELMLHDSQRKNTSTEHEILALKAEKSSLESKLKTSQASYHDIRTNYSQMLKVLQQVSEGDDGLHSYDNSTLVVPVSSIVTHPRSTPERLSLDTHFVWAPQRALQSLQKLKGEIHSLRKKDQQQLEKLEQSKRDIHRSHEEKTVLEARIQTLQSSLSSLQTSFDSVSRQRNKAEATAKEAKKTILELQTRKEELQQEIRNMQQQLQLCTAVKDSMERKHQELEQQIKELNSSYIEEVSSLKSEVSRLQSSHLAKDRQLVQLEEKLQRSTQQMGTGSISSESTQTNRSEELSTQKELAENEIQTQVQSLASQLTESQRRAESVREENARLQKEILTLSKEVERLRERLQTTTVDKQRLSQSQEKEIERLRREVERHMQKSSGLKVQLLQYSGQSLMDTPVPSVAARLTPVGKMQFGHSEEVIDEGAESGVAKEWREQCHKHKRTIQHLQSKVRQLESEISKQHGNETKEQDETQPILQLFPDHHTEQTALWEPHHSFSTDQQSSGLEQPTGSVLRGGEKVKTTSVLTSPSVGQHQADITMSAGPFTSTPMKHSTPSTYHTHQDTN